MAKPTPHNDRDHGRFAAGLFAATVVMTSGIGLCLALAFLFAPDAWWPLVVILAGFAALCATFWILSETPLRTAKDTNLYGVRKEQADEYVQSFRPRRRRRRHADFGTNQPPSVDGLRQIKEDSNVWYPSERRAEEYRRNLGES